MSVFLGYLVPIEGNAHDGVGTLHLDQARIEALLACLAHADGITGASRVCLLMEAARAPEHARAVAPATFRSAVTPLLADAASVPPPVLQVGDLRIDWDTMTIYRAGRPVPTAPKEFDLFCALLRRHGAVASRLDLLAEVWGHRAAVLTRTVDTHVRMLRAKIEPNPREPSVILTVRKRGYRIAC